MMDSALPRLGLRTLLVACLLIPFASPGLAEAQGRAGCASPQPPSIGIAFGRSSPYIELARGAVDRSGPGTVAAQGGAQFVGRADLCLTGPLRLHIEAARAQWDIRQRTYSPDDVTVTADESVDHMSACHLVALAGIRLGRAPACAHISAGGGVYALGFRGESVWRPGAVLSAGIELPTGGHGAIQVDAVLHLIGTRDAHPIASSAVPALNLLVGWAYRF